MKNYYFNTSDGREYRIAASNLPSALTHLADKLVSDDNSNKVHPYYYSSSVRKIPLALFDEYLADLSFCGYENVCS